MVNPKLPEPELLKAILEPLLEDFRYWFERSRQLLEEEEIDFLTREERSDLLTKIKQAQKEVNASAILFEATEAQVGVETPVLIQWHKLLTTCWQISARYRKNSNLFGNGKSKTTN
ncbi:MAG: DUF2605 domain-containing protein [Okeania sp. SIO2H7]|nr:DUF2605 domain-containing protein [Okeania sp. SIO2H7]